MTKIGLFIMGAKGYCVLSTLINSKYSQSISFVVASKDKSVVKDYYEEIKNLTEENNIVFFERNKITKDLCADYFFAISWRWLIKEQMDKLIIFHDSLLPRYRGFAPLVAALIEGDNEIGVTAIRANLEFDKGNILGQEKIHISYPIKIEHAINVISGLYGKLILFILESIYKGAIKEIEQNEETASYSLWRDEEDYYIDWNLDACKIKRFIDAVGFPYNGAITNCDGEMIRITDVEEIPDRFIINRTAGKLLFIEEGNPVVVCGKGLLMIKIAYIANTNQQYIFNKLRVRLKNENNFQ